MKWMKFTNADGLTIYCNMARAVSVYARLEAGSADGAYIDFGDGQPTPVTSTPEEIIARGEWLVK